MKYFGYIYETTNNINGKKYIGKKKSSTFDENYIGSGVLLQKAIEKYGKVNFSVKILKWCETREILNESEKYFIKSNNVYKSIDYYNIASGGEGGNTYAGKSDDEMTEIKLKISNSNKGSNNGNKGQYVGEKNSMFGKKQTKEARIKISEGGKKVKINRSHPWTEEKQAKRQATQKRYRRYWKVYKKSTNEFFENFTNKSIWLKTISDESYKLIDYLDKFEINRGGTFIFGDLEFNVEIIDTETLTSDELKEFEQKHLDYKKYVYNKRLLHMKKCREEKRNKKV